MTSDPPGDPTVPGSTPEPGPAPALPGPPPAVPSPLPGAPALEPASPLLSPGPGALDEPEPPVGLLARLVPPGTGRSLALARLPVVGAGLGAFGLLAPLGVLLFAEAPRPVDVAMAGLLAVGSLGFLGACGGAVSGLAERGLAARPVARWAALTLAPGLLTWLVALQLVYLVGAKRAGIQAGYERLGALLDPTSRDAIYALTFALGSGVGLGLVLAQLVHRRLGGRDLRAQLLGALGVLVRVLLAVGCGGALLLCLVAAVIEAVGSTQKLQGNIGQALIALWMSSLASLVSLGVVAALVGPWLLRVADRLEARLRPGAPRP